MSVQSKPAGYHSVTPYLVARDAHAAIAFYKEAFGAVETCKLLMPDGSICHAEIQIGDAKIMLGEENPQWGSKSPLALGGTPGGFMIYVPDADAAFAQALKAGATVEKPVEDQFWGDRTGSVIDPFGHKWTLATHVEDVSEHDMQARLDGWIASMSQEQKHAA
jgi:PhnB protein